MATLKNATPEPERLDPFPDLDNEETVSAYAFDFCDEDAADDDDCINSDFAREVLGLSCVNGESGKRA